MAASGKSRAEANSGPCRRCASKSYLIPRGGADAAGRPVNCRRLPMLVFEFAGVSGSEREPVRSGNSTHGSFQQLERLLLATLREGYEPLNQSCGTSFEFSDIARTDSEPGDTRSHTFSASETRDVAAGLQSFVALLPSEPEKAICLSELHPLPEDPNELEGFQTGAAPPPCSLSGSARAA